MYNAARLTYATITSTDFLLQSLFQTHLKVDNTGSLFYPLRYMVQSYLMGNAYDTYDQKDLIFGYQGQTAYKVNGGEFKQGADFSLTNAITPVVND